MLTVEEQIKRARAAAAIAEKFDQERTDDCCLAAGWELYEDENIKRLSKLAVEETGYGEYDSKVVKHKRKVGGVLFDVQGAKSVGLLERNEKTGISKYAKPVGVVCAILPATNPTATAGQKAVSALKGRNAIIFKPSSRARECTRLAVDFMRQGLKRIGAPEDLVQFLEDPSREGISKLMAESDLVVATGSGAVVKAAYSSGTPAYGVGKGNAIVIIAEDADIPDAVAKIRASETFDNATSCSSENSMVVHEDIYDQVKAEIVKANGYILNEDEREALRDHLWKPNKKGVMGLNPGVIAQNAQTIAGQAGLKIPAEIDWLIAEVDGPVEEERYFDEKICPVIALTKYSAFEKAVETVQKIADLYGPGHSCGIHTFKQSYIEYLGMVMRSARITVRQPMSAANGGHAFNRMPSTATLGCGTWGGNVTTENVHYKHYLNITWVNEPVEPYGYTDEEMWGEFWKKYGK